MRFESLYAFTWVVTTWKYCIVIVDSSSMMFNAEFWSNCATVVAAIISIASLWLAIWINHDAKMPQIAVSLEYDGDNRLVYLVVNNYGNGVARDIKFSDYDEEIFPEDFRPQIMKSFVKRGIPTLIPNAKRSTIVAGGNLDESLVELSSEITITYYVRGLFSKNKKVSERTILEYLSFAQSLYAYSDLKRIRKALEKIAKSIDCTVKPRQVDTAQEFIEFFC